MKIHMTSDFRSGVIKATWIDEIHRCDREEEIQIPVERLEGRNHVNRVAADIANLLLALGHQAALEILT